MPVINLNDVAPREMMPGFNGRLVHTEGMTFVEWHVSAGALLPEHSHPHEQVTAVQEGEFEMTIDGRKNQLTPGLVAVIPSNVLHSGRAVTDCTIIDVFHPVREDYR
jgi:quercetin dioxygenase-like cupin family protein